MYKHPVSLILRYFLRHWPITDGKKFIAKKLQPYSIPENKDVTVVMNDGFLLQLNLSNPEHIHMFLYGEHDERYEKMILKKIVRKDDICWDIGANIGFYSLLFSKLAPQGKILAFEPAASTRKLLETSIVTNKAKNIFVHPYAIGNFSGQSRIYYSQASNAEGTASLESSPGKTNSEEIIVKKIDDLSNIPFPNIIKIDVEGLQNEVLEGAMDLLSNSSPIIMAELKDHKEKMAKSQEIIRHLGYKAFTIKKNKLEHCADLVSCSSRNYILCRQDHPNFERIRPLIQ